MSATGGERINLNSTRQEVAYQFCWVFVLNQHSTRRDRDDVNNFVITHGDQLIHHVNSDADVVWYYPYYIPNRWFVVASRKVEKSVLLCKFVNAGIGVFQHSTEAIKTAGI